MTGKAVDVGVAVGPMLVGVGLGRRAVGVAVGGGVSVRVGTKGVGTITAVGVAGSTVAGTEKVAVGVGGCQARPEGSNWLRAN